MKVSDKEMKWKSQPFELIPLVFSMWLHKVSKLKHRAEKTHFSKFICGLRTQITVGYTVKLNFFFSDTTISLQS